MIAKRKGSLYEPGRRSGAWLKYKLHRSQEFVIGGYTAGNPFDALIVGCYRSLGAGVDGRAGEPPTAYGAQGGKTDPNRR